MTTIYIDFTAKNCVDCLAEWDEYVQTPELWILLKGVTILQLPSSYLLISINRSKLIFGIALSIIVLVGAYDCDAQTEYEDVVYLKNGEIRRGIIIEEIPFK